MAAIRLKNKHNGFTMLPNRFIDEYMPLAGGEYVKVYLYLLRQAGLSEPHVSVEDIAEHLMHTEKDIIRALKYWEKQGLLLVSFSENQECDSIELLFPGTEASSRPNSKSVSPEAESAAVTHTVSKAPARQDSNSAEDGDFSMACSDFHGEDIAPFSSSDPQEGESILSSPSDFHAGEATPPSPSDFHTEEAAPSFFSDFHAGEAIPSYASDFHAGDGISSSGSDANSYKSAPDSDFRESAQKPDAVSPAFGTRDDRKAPAASLTPPPRRSYTPQEIEEITERESLEEMIFVINSYMGRPLSQTELTCIIYFYDQLKFSIELIEYLFEYCISKNHKSIRYIEKTALNWAEDHISTPEEARQRTAGYSEDCFAVLKAFGISGRNPVESEIRFVKLWRDDYQMSTELIVDACSRTMAQIHSPSFEYADGILSGWKKAEVKTPGDVKKLDEAFAAKKQSGGRAANRQNRGQADAQRGGSSRPSQTRFSNFEERSYSASDDANLEKLLLSRYREQKTGT